MNLKTAYLFAREQYRSLIFREQRSHLLNTLLKIPGLRLEISRRNRQKKAYAEFKKSKKPKIKYLNLELTNVCNLNCRYCLMDNSRPKGFMNISLLKKIIKEIEEKRILIERFNLYNTGESLLHPQLKDFLDLLARAKQRNKSFPKVKILTNGVLMNKRMQKMILESAAVDKIGFSIDGGNKEEFEYWRRGAKWEPVIRNANSLIDLNKEIVNNIRVGMTSIFTGKLNYSPEFKELIQRVDEYWPIRPHNWDGSQNLLDLKIKCQPKKSFCDHILNEFVILWDGRVSACCNDLNGRGIIGDFNKQSVSEIYFGKIRKVMLTKMAKSQRQKIKLCQNCSM